MKVGFRENDNKGGGEEQEKEGGSEEEHKVKEKGFYFCANCVIQHWKVSSELFVHAIFWMTHTGLWDTVITYRAGLLGLAWRRIQAEGWLDSSECARPQ